jgi:hypothetical protein
MRSGGHYFWSLSQNNPSCLLLLYPLRKVTETPRTESLSDIFIPKVWLGADEIGHHLNAVLVIEYNNLDAALPEQVLGAHEVLVFTDDDARDAIQQRGTGAHDAGAKRTDQRQLWPIAAAACIADADCLGMRGWISSLHSKIVAASDNAALAIRKYRANRQTTFAKACPGLFERLGQQFAIVHELWFHRE